MVGGIPSVSELYLVFSFSAWLLRPVEAIPQCPRKRLLQARGQDAWGRPTTHARHVVLPLYDLSKGEPAWRCDSLTALS